jgi:hypothetical protein
MLPFTEDDVALFVMTLMQMEAWISLGCEALDADQPELLPAVFHGMVACAYQFLLAKMSNDAHRALEGEEEDDDASAVEALESLLVGTAGRGNKDPDAQRALEGGGEEEDDAAFEALESLLVVGTAGRENEDPDAQRALEGGGGDDASASEAVESLPVGTAGRENEDPDADREDDEQGGEPLCKRPRLH